MYKSNGVEKSRKWPVILGVIFAVFVLGGVSYGVYKYFLKADTPEQTLKNYVTFDSSVTADEQENIKNAISEQQILVNSPVTVSIETTTNASDNPIISSIYVPVTNIYSIKQNITTSDLVSSDIRMYAPTDVGAQTGQSLGLTNFTVLIEPFETGQLTEESVNLVNVDDLTPQIKLLIWDENYYLDGFDSGAVFRIVKFEGEGSSSLSILKLKDSLNKEQVFKANITGVTALTRVMSKKLAEVGDPLYFSAKIGDFVADADLTHVSNEVSFKDGCEYSNTAFCSPPQFIETLKASGVDLVELTGNHNNDVGSVYNTQTIELYKSLGWGTVGGGLNNDEAKLPFLADTKGSKVTILAYNYPDSPNGVAISGSTTAGANRFDFDFTSIEADIKAAKGSSDFVQVNVQYWECYAYPDGFVEFPICDKPIGEQEATFKKLIDLGADMVVGSSAHQPQTYEMYKSKPIYYGIGNLYFDQVSWPGTERGIILTNYFVKGKLIQTKLTPTVYDRDLQTRKMTNTESEYLLTRLHDAR